MRRTLGILVALLVVATAVGCKKKAPEAPPVPDVPTSAADTSPAPAAEAPEGLAADGPAAGATSGGTETGGPAPARSEYLLETVGDWTVLAMRPDGFEKLSLEQKRLAYHLYRAAIAGDPIFYDQHYRHNPAIKSLLEALARHPEGVDSELHERLVTYLKKVWINHGIHDTMNGDKLVPDITYEDLQAAARAALAAGVELLGTKDEATLLAKLEELRGPMFDPEVDPFATRRTVPEGRDLLTASSNNFYEGVTQADLEGFTEQYALNSRLVKRNGKLVELPWRAGAAGVEPGLYATELRAVVRHVRAAMAESGEAQRTALGHLARWFETGDSQAFRDYNIAWVRDDPPVDAILGFIEVYADPRNQKGAWEGVVFFPDVAEGEAIRKLAANAAYFESKLPYAEAYKRTEFNPPLANRVVSLVHTGDAGPVSPGGINLPNAQDIRQEHGSKSIDIGNLGAAVDAVTGELAIREFAWDDAERELALRCREAMRRQGIAYHEVIGHGSGKVPETLTGDPADHLPGTYNTIEEARAEAVALYLAFDPKTVEIGMLPSADCAVAVGQSYLRNGLLVLRRLPPGGIVEEDHWRAMLLIVGYAIDKGAARVERRDDRFYIVMNDPERWRATVGELLAELMRIKAEGDAAAATRLVETYGARYDEARREDVLERVEALGYPKKYAFVSPILRPVLGPDGTITDVVAEPAPSLA
ncbi:MAG: peptidase, partial [Deltaproteobacteria bacterium]|nr:peptidase [Deltaproteobacteria bacterium]